MQVSIEQIRYYSPWFARLNPISQQQLMAGACYRQLATGERLFDRGAKFDGIYLILNGTLLISGLHSSGKEALLTIVSRGDWFGEIALFDQQSRTHDATASSQVTLYHFPAAFLHQLLQQHAEWWQLFGQLLTQKLRLAFAALEDISLQPASVRLARRLLQLSQWPNEMTQRVIPIQQEQLGQLLSLSRQTTNQLLQQFAQQGAIKIAYASIELTNIELLLQLAANDEFSH